MQRCFGCMREFGNEYDVCPYCGYIVGTPAESKNHLEPGTVLQDRYILGKSLGQGGFGITYIAWDKKVEKAVAIKEYMPSAFASRITGELEVSCYNNEAQKQFNIGLEKTQKETRMMARFNELESVVEVYDCINENGTAYIVMELLRGATVKDILNDKKTLSFNEAMRIMVPVMETLNAMHSVGLIHRDVAPDNIFVCDNGKVKLLDFGAARVISGFDDKSRSIVLKHGYAPKEQYMSKGRQGAFTDVYAVCATVYKLLTGTTLPESIGRSDSGDELREIDKCTDVSEKAKKAILHGLRVNIDDRTRDINELLGELQSEIPDSASAVDTQKFLKFKSKHKKRKLLSIVLPLIAVAVALVTGITFFAHHKKDIPDVPADNTTISATEKAEPTTEKPKPEVTATMLKQKLEDEAGGTVKDFYFGDYNGDGEYEAFSLIPRDTESSDLYSAVKADFYFVSANKTVKITSYEAMEIEGRYLNLTAESDVYGYFVYEGFGTGMEEKVYTVATDGSPVYTNLCSRSEILYSDYGWFLTCKQAYEDRSFGRNYKGYFVYFDKELCSFVEYGAIEITKDQLFSLPGANELLKDIPGNKIKNILYYGNDAVRINYTGSDSVVYESNATGREIELHRTLFIFDGKLSEYNKFDDYSINNKSDKGGVALSHSVECCNTVEYPTSFPYGNSEKIKSLDDFVNLYQKNFVGLYLPWWSDSTVSFDQKRLDLDSDGTEEILLSVKDDSYVYVFIYDNRDDKYYTIFDTALAKNYEIDSVEDLFIKQRNDGTYCIVEQSLYDDTYSLFVYDGKCTRKEKQIYSLSWDDPATYYLIDHSVRETEITKQEYTATKKEIENSGKTVFTF